MGYISRAIALSMALCTLVLVAAPVHATSPGENGLISFRRYFNDKHTSGALFVVNPDGSHETRITFPALNQLDYTQNWSPDGSQLAFERVTFTPESETHEIWVVNVDGSNPHRLFPCPGDDVCRAALLASWSPDGQWIAFSLAMGPVTNHQSADVSIWAIHPDGTGLRQITHPTGFQRSEDFDPSGLPTEPGSSSSAGWRAETGSLRSSRRIPPTDQTSSASPRRVSWRGTPQIGLRTGGGSSTGTTRLLARSRCSSATPTAAGSGCSSTGAASSPSRRPRSRRTAPG